MNFISTLTTFLSQMLVLLTDKTGQVGLVAIGVGIIEVGMGFSSIAEGLVVSSALKGMARNPEVSSKLSSSMILGVSLCETVAIYGLVLAILVIFVA